MAGICPCQVVAVSLGCGAPFARPQWRCVNGLLAAAAAPFPLCLVSNGVWWLWQPSQPQTNGECGKRKP